MPKSKSSYSLVAKIGDKTKELKLNISSPKVAREVVSQLASQNIQAVATLTISRVISTEDK